MTYRPSVLVGQCQVPFGAIIGGGAGSQVPDQARVYRAPPEDLARIVRQCGRGKNRKYRRNWVNSGSKPADGGRERATWTLGLPGGRELDITVHPIPLAGECEHRYESAGHDPSPLLRHLTEVRDGTCTRPGCARPATRCDFEHTVPFERGGRTCLCNGNPKCRHDHQLKQTPGWVNTQIRPGFHSWTTPSGRTYIRGPIEYPT